jgi:hypothetical protein
MTTMLQLLLLFICMKLKMSLGVVVEAGMIIQNGRSRPGLVTIILAIPLEKASLARLSWAGSKMAVFR